MKRTALFSLAALAPLLLAGQALAQDASAAAQDAVAQTPTPVGEVIVTGEITFRNRVEGAAPVLSYDTEYFQRFEPLTAGDAMKRVPSVQFLSDVLESDGARLRGLDPGYTQILINGERVPGSGVDRSFFVDRIPAELIDRIEIVRSPSANRSGDAVAGSLNIVLRDGYAIDGGYLRGGALRFDDGELKGTLGGVWSGQVGPGRLIVGASAQGRYNPKNKLSLRYPEPGDPIDNIEVQTDVRDGTDYSANFSYQLKGDASELELSGLYVKTDRIQDEDSVEYIGGNPVTNLINVINDNDVTIDQQNWSLRSKYGQDMLGGRTTLKLGYAAFDETTFEFEDETEYRRDAVAYPEDDRFTHDTMDGDVKDSETSAALEHKRDIAGGAAKLEFGVQYNRKERDSYNLFLRARDNIPNPQAARPTLPGAIDVGDTVRDVSNIQETRIDPYIMVSGETGFARWEVGLRYETTDTKITSQQTLGAGPAIPGVGASDSNELLPSASVRFDLSPVDRLTLSIGKTVRRPKFDDITPRTLTEEVGDDDLRGNPLLRPEIAWGGDIGFERRLGRRGVVGINAFYRSVSDVIELQVVATPGSGGAGTKIFQPVNSGDGKVWGVEFDASTPLSFIGLENTGVFLNYSWLDSDIPDFIGERRFNDQADFVFNLGFIQDVPSLGVAFGATYRKQGDSQGRVLTEEVTTSYGGDLEMFVEKRFGERLVLRLTGSNLLDASKDEVFHKFASDADQIARDYDEYEVETESAGPWFQLVARLTF